MKDGISDRRRRADDADLTDAARSHRVRMAVTFVEPDRVDILDIGVRCDVVAREIRIHDMPESRIEHALLVKSRRESHRHSADELRPRGPRVDDPTNAEHAEEPWHADLPGAGVH